MRKAIALSTLVLALFAFGCAGGMKDTMGQPVTEESKIKCPKCGAEFTLGEAFDRMSKTP